MLPDTKLSFSPSRFGKAFGKEDEEVDEDDDDCCGGLRRRRLNYRLELRFIEQVDEQVKWVCVLLLTSELPTCFFTLTSLLVEVVVVVVVL